MSESENKQTWSAPPGVPVYGAVPGAPPPDFERPWEFAAGRPVAPPPPAPAVVAPPHAAPPPIAAAGPSVEWAPQPAPLPQPMRPPMPVYHRPLPAPLGPAMTPEERYYQLNGRPLPPP